MALVNPGAALRSGALAAVDMALGGGAINSAESSWSSKSTAMIGRAGPAVVAVLDEDAGVSYLGGAA